MSLTVEVDTILQQPDTWYLVDSIPRPGEYNAVIILVSSPRKDNYREFSKYDGVQTLYMPPWSKEELELCGKRLFADIDVSTSFPLFGGVPRQIFSGLNESTFRLEQALAKYGSYLFASTENSELQ